MPAPDELEVSLFGPGYGECVLVHLGLGEWLIIDSCVNQYEGGNPALDYLKSLAIDPAEAVRLIVASHWDDDHVHGWRTSWRSVRGRTSCVPWPSTIFSSSNSSNRLEMIRPLSNRG
jgi:hypothetical protein